MQEQYVPTQTNKSILVSNQSQEGRILWTLQAAYPNWVPAIELSHISLQYSARVFSLRRKGWQIANKVETQKDGTKYGFFRLATPNSFPNPKRKPVASESQVPASELLATSPATLFDMTPQHKDLG